MREENDIIEEYIKFTMNKKAIIRIKDTSKNLDIKITNGLTFYFLTCVSIVYVISIFIFGVLLYKDVQNNTSYLSSFIVIVTGMLLFLFILIGVTIYEGKKRRFKVSYIDEDHFKINNKIFDIKAHYCVISVSRNYYTTYNLTSGYSYMTFYYAISISQDKLISEWKITDKKAEEFRDFIYNFDYEISEEKGEILQEIYDMQKERCEKYNLYKISN